MKQQIILTIVTLIVINTYGQTQTHNENPYEPDIKVTLLGTGTPLPIIERFGACILVQAGGESFLFDAGRGCLQRLRQAGLSYDKISALFLTHLHSDHIVGLPDLWLTGWLTSRRTIPLKVYGPDGTANLTEYLRKAFAYDIKIRIEDDGASEEGSKLLTTEIQEGIIYENNGVKVTAFEVDHFPIAPAFGYRIEFRGRSVVLSGDTRYSENLIKFAKGTDLLIHEVAIAPDTLTRENQKYSILAHHTTTRQAGNIFNETKPKLAVYSHIVKIYDTNEKGIINQTREAYSGPLIMGEDLMSFSVDDSVYVNARKDK